MANDQSDSGEGLAKERVSLMKADLSVAVVERILAAGRKVFGDDATMLLTLASDGAGVLWILFVMDRKVEGDAYRSSFAHTEPLGLLDMIEQYHRDRNEQHKAAPWPPRRKPGWLSNLTNRTPRG